MIIDLHIHGKYSQATSKNITISTLSKYAQIKGVDLLGTGDFTHPKWIQEIKNNLSEDETGILKTKDGFPFMLQTELSLIYSQGGKGRRVHNVVLAPSLEVVEQITEWLLTKGRVDYDGRPIFKIPCPEFVESLRKISKDIEVIPAHIWTPWFSMFGAKSGFDTMQDCFQDQTKHIHAIETGLSCYDSKTEVLTDNGWKKFCNLKKTDEICTLNKKTYEVEFQKPRKYFTNNYEGKMYKLKTKRVNLLVTPNHNLFISHCDFRKKPEFKLKEARDSINLSKRFKKDGKWIGKDEKFFILPEVKVPHGSRFYSGNRIKKEKKIPMGSWLKFFGFWIAEGWTTYDKSCSGYNVCLSHTKKKTINKFKKILSSFGYNPYYCEKSATIRVRDFQLFQYLRKFGKSHEKFIPPEVKNLSPKLLKIFFYNYIPGDGHRYGRNKKGLSATTISTRLRDDLQEIALKIGISAYYKLHQKKGTLITSINADKGYKQSEDSWNIYFIRQNIHTTLPSTIKKYNYKERWVKFKGKVYCVSVPNQVIYVRREGIPVWCGNSDPPMNWRLKQLDNINIVSFSDLHSYWPWRLGRESTIVESKQTYKDIVNTLRTGDKLKGTIEVDPNYGKYHFTGHRKCDVCVGPKESKGLNYICPKCKAEMTRGVAERVEELADRPEGYVRPNAPSFHTLLPLHELICTVNKIKQPTSKKVGGIFEDLIKNFKSEYNILLNTSEEELNKIVDPKLTDVIIKNRIGKIKIKPGYDGVYGELEL